MSNVTGHFRGQCEGSHGMDRVQTGEHHVNDSCAVWWTPHQRKCGRPEKKAFNEGLRTAIDRQRRGVRIELREVVSIRIRVCGRPDDSLIIPTE